MNHIIVKVSDICNLACDYCSYYAADGYDRKTSVMSLSTVQLLYERIAEHCAEASVRKFEIYWHGGEPLTIGSKVFRQLMEMQSEMFPPGLVIGNTISTNATLIDGEWLELFRKFRVSVGVSIDGPRAINDIHRNDKAQNSSFDRSVEGLRLLQQNGINPMVRSVLQGNVAGGDLYRFIVKELGVNRLDVLLPLASHAKPVGDSEFKQRLARQAIEVFDAWLDDPESEKVRVRWFESAVRNLIGGSPTLCSMQGKCSGILTIGTDGDIYLCDDLSVSNNAIFSTGLHIRTASLAQAQSGWYKTIHEDGLTIHRDCATCDVFNICRGGCPATRFSKIGFTQPSHNCDIFIPLYRHIASRVGSMLPETEAMA